MYVAHHLYPNVTLNLFYIDLLYITYCILCNVCSFHLAVFPNNIPQFLKIIFNYDDIYSVKNKIYALKNVTMLLNNFTSKS